MFNFPEISKNLFILAVIHTLISIYPKLSNYTPEIKFSIYRSMMCITFSIMGLNILINNFTCMKNPFSFTNDAMMEIFQLFTAYLILDFIQMIATKCKRYDLYIHHIVCMCALFISHITNSFGYIHSILFIAESLSVISGIDNMAIHDNDMELSYYCKKIRKTIITYVRYPLWVLLILTTIYFTNNIPNLLWYNCLATGISMLTLYHHWKKKCNKVINKYV